MKTTRNRKHLPVGASVRTQGDVQQGNAVRTKAHGACALGLVGALTWAGASSAAPASDASKSAETDDVSAAADATSASTARDVPSTSVVRKEGRPSLTTVAVSVRGQDRDHVREEVIRAAFPTYTVIGTVDLEDALDGDTELLGPPLTDPNRRQELVRSLGRARQQVGADLVLAVYSRPNRQKDRELSLLLVSAKGAVVNQVLVLPHSLSATERAQRIQSVLDPDARPKASSSTLPPATSAPSAVPATARGAEPEHASADTHPLSPIDSGTSFVQASVGFEVGGRKVSFSDPLSNNLRPYQLSGAPGVALEGMLFPLRSGGDILRNLGVVVRYARAFSLLTESPTHGESIGTSWSRSSAGLRGRIPLDSRADAPQVGVELTYGQWAFSYADSGALSAVLPDVSYSIFRIGGDLRYPLPIAGLALFGGAAYLDVLSAGDFVKRFRRARVAGVSAELGVSKALNSWLSARVSGKYDRFFYGLSPDKGDRYIAGGALDQYWALQIGATAAY